MFDPTSGDLVCAFCSEVYTLAPQCTYCGWAGGVALGPESDHYIVLLALMKRAPLEAEDVYLSHTGISFRLVPTERELAVLDEGTCLRLGDDELWRISAIGRDSLLLRCSFVIGKGEDAQINSVKNREYWDGFGKLSEF